MASYKFYLTHGGTLNGVKVEPNGLIATIEVPDGLQVDRVIRAMATGMATQNGPEEEKKAAETANPAVVAQASQAGADAAKK